MLDLLYKRRSIRQYKDTPVEQDKVEKIIKGALLAPSARSLFPQQFIVIDDKALIEKLAKSKEHGSSFLKNASLAVVVLADEKISDVWVEDASIAATYIQLVAESLGLGSCWIQIRNRKHNENLSSEDYIKSLLNIPADLKVECIISIGYPDESKPPHNDSELRYEKVFLNSYNTKYQ